MKILSESITGLECVSVRSPENTTAVVLFHGYGANMHDLFPLWELWHRENFNWFFPNGVLPLPMGYYGGRSWFSIDVEGLERSLREGTQRDMAGFVAPEFEDTLKAMEAFLGEIARTHSKIIVGGFSQGAMCASHLATKNIPGLDGLILLSGNLVAESHFPKDFKAIPFYQSHGNSDPILPLEGARVLEKRLKDSGCPGKLHVFPGGHEIPMSVIHEVKKFLEIF